MTPVSIAGPSSVQTRHRPRPRAALRILGAVALLLAGAMPSEAAARVRGGPAAAVKQSADTVSVTLAAPADGTVAEGDTAHFEVGVTGDTSAGAVTVQYAVSGTAKPGEDYAELSGELTVEAGATGALIAVATVADDIEDDGETVTNTLTNWLSWVGTTDGPGWYRNFEYLPVGRPLFQ